MRVGSWNVEELEPIAAEAMGRARRELDAKAGLGGALITSGISAEVLGRAQGSIAFVGPASGWFG